ASRISSRRYRRGRNLRRMRTMSIKLEYLGEPKLQFGHYFEHEDTKTGLAEYGPFGKNVSGLHPGQIKLGFIGTRETISGAKEWVQACTSPIESENIRKVPGPRDVADGLFVGEAENDPQLLRYEKILNRDFIGFNGDSQFGCSFQMNDRWDKN